MAWIFLIVASIVAGAVSVVALRTWGALALRRLELDAQFRHAELTERFLAGELNPAPTVLGPSIDEIRRVVRTELVDHDIGDAWVVDWAKRGKQKVSRIG